MNPLLDFSGLPRYSEVQPDHVTPAVDQLLGENRALVETLCGPATRPTWTAFVQPLEDANERLSRAWGQVSHLHSVLDSPELREVYNANLPKITQYYAELGQHEGLFLKYKALAGSDEYAGLTPARRKIVDNELRDFRLSGAELPEDRKPRFKEIQEELSALGAKFSENLLDATNAHAELVDDEATLAGLPDDVKAAARAAAEKDGRAGWKLTLHAPSYIPVLQYGDDRGLRARMYRAYATRAAEFTDGSSKAEWNNGPLIERILALRAEEARMLGYANYAEVSLATKMADTPAQVAAFLRDMARKARLFAERDVGELREFARDELGMDMLESWDLAWASEKLKQRRYSFSDDEVKQYFPEPQVLAGLFRVIESLFSVRIVADATSVWHPDVRFFRIERDGRPIGRFYLDLYARDTKRGGAWMDEAITRRRLGGGVQLPVAYLNCNFPAPVPGSGRPATFSHDDVITLFHECGHGLHHLLTQVDELPVSGIHGVEWDAVELPSQFMENFCWEWDVLAGMTAHVDSGAPLPRELYERMLAAKNFQSGLQTLRQIEFALFDMRLHSEHVPGAGVTVQQLLDAVRAEVAVLIPPSFNRFQNGFSHIFAGGYAAGYYSYKWAEVLSADAYAAFEEAREAQDADTRLAQTGRRFLDEILAVGGSRPAIDSFRAFRGRDPRLDALLRHNGMVEESAREPSNA